MGLIEREEHVGYLQRLIGESRRKRGQVALVEGPAGSGKSELLHRLTEEATESGMLTLRAACSPAERTLPFGALSQLFHSVALSADVDARVAALLETGAALPGADPAAPEAADPELYRVMHQLCLVLLKLAGETPLLIGIDDVQYIDVPSQRCLLYLARRLASARILAVLTVEADLPPSHCSFRGDLLRLPHFHRLGLAPLSSDGVARYLARHLDEETARRLEPEFFGASGGNLLLLQALVEDHRLSGGVRVQGYGLAFVNHLYRGEAQLLGTARALAVLGDGATPTELARLAGSDALTVTAALHAMTIAGLLADGFFRHAVARLAVVNDLSPEERRGLHRAAADLLHDQDDSATRIAHHLVEAGSADAPWAVGALLEAAGQWLLGGNLRAAVQGLELAHGAPGTSDRERAAIRAELARAEWQSNPSSAARHLTHLVTAAGAGRLDHRDEVALVRQLVWHGRVDEARDVLDKLRAAEHDATELADLDVWLAGTHPALAPHGLPLSAAGDGPQRNPLVTPASDPWLRSAAALSGHLLRGRNRDAAARGEQALRDLRLSRRTSWADEAALLALLTLVYADRPASAVEWCSRAQTDSGAAWSPVRRAVFAAARAEGAVRLGDLPEAVRQAQTALTHLAPRAWGVAVGLPLGSLVLAATRMGDYDLAARRLAWPVPEAMLRSRYGLHYLYARGHHYLAVNHTHAALADFLSCGELMRGWGLDAAGIVPWRTSAAEAWLQLGNKDQARRMIHDQLARPGTDSSRTRGLALRLLADVSPVARRPQLLAEAMDLAEEYNDRYEQARVLADLGRSHYALAQSQRARMVLRRARHMAAMCEAVPLKQELLSVPGDLHSAAEIPEGPDVIATLTDSEHRVASLAVVGYTNREIADKLYVTPSTVEQHLTRVFRKLGVKRRRDLPADLAAVVTEMGRRRSVS